MKDFLKCTGVGVVLISGTVFLCYYIGSLLLPLGGPHGWMRYFAQSMIGLLCLVVPAIAIVICYLVGSDIVHPSKSGTDYSPR